MRVAIVMTTGLVSSDDLLLSPTHASPVDAESPALPAVPAATYQAEAKTSSIVGMMPMQPMPDSVMSPDEMLRAYAERRAMASPPPIVAAPAAVHYDGNGMRTLYSPTTPNSAAMLMAPATPLADRQSAAPSEWSKYDDDNDTAYVQ